MNASVKTPWWFWCISILGVLWSLMGAFDYVMLKTENADYLAKFTPEALSYFQNLPFWVVTAWAIAIWAGLLAWLCLLLRKRWAVPLFVLSLIALVINFIYWIPSGGWSLQGVAGQIFTLIVLLIAVFGVWFSRKMRARAILS